MITQLECWNKITIIKKSNCLHMLASQQKNYVYIRAVPKDCNNHERPKSTFKPYFNKQFYLNLFLI